MRILGISAFRRDSSAALVIDGVPIAAYQEERFTRKRLDPAFPSRSIRACLDAGGLRPHELDQVVFYEKPLRKFERLLATQLQAFPRSSKAFASNMFLWLGDRLWMKNRVADEIGVPVDRIRFGSHQLSNAATGFYLSPYEEAAVLTMDDEGEWATSALGRGDQNEIELLHELHFPHSLGLVASAITQFLGFEPGSDEDLVEALAAHGSLRFRHVFDELVVPGDDGAFRVDRDAFRFHFDMEQLFSERLEELLGPRRYPGAELRIAAPDARDADIAASLQVTLEERVLASATQLKRLVSSENLCFSGALARNLGVNTRLVSDGPFANVFISPVPDDSGGALGVALAAQHALTPTTRRQDLPTGAALYAEQLDGSEEVDPVTTLVAQLGSGRALGLVAGPLEFGRLSLGNRCLLRHAADADARLDLLRRVQKSEAYLPCRVLMRAADASRYVEGAAAALTAMRHAQLRLRATSELKSSAPSAVGPDGRAWPQVVSAEHGSLLNSVLDGLSRAGHAPLLLIADFALRGAPIVRTESEAVDALRRSTLDGVLVENRLYRQA